MDFFTLIKLGEAIYLHKGLQKHAYDAKKAVDKLNNAGVFKEDKVQRVARIVSGADVASKIIAGNKSLAHKFLSPLKRALNKVQ